MKDRVALWDNVKFLMILLVVLGHFVDEFSDVSKTGRGIFLLIYTFHMPVLFFISGIFYSRKNQANKVMFYISCAFLLKMVLTVLGHSKFSLLSDSALPWFMIVLAYCNIFVYLTEKFDKKFLLIATVTLACFCGYDMEIGDFLCLSRFIVFLPFYLAGTMIHSQDFIDFRKKHYRILLPFAIICLSISVYLCFGQLKSVYIYRHLFTGRNPFSPNVIDYGTAARLGCYMVSALNGLAIIILCPNIHIKGITYMGSKTLNVYFWHWPIFLVANVIFPIHLLYQQGLCGKIAYLSLAVVLTVVLSAVKVFDFPLKQLEQICFKKIEKNV